MNRLVSSRSILTLFLLLFTAGVVFLLTGCSSERRPRESETSSSAETTRAEIYEVRGEVVELPDPNDPTTGFYVRHEAIDEFRSMDGEIVGMDSMTMPFSVADEISFEGISVGDPITFRLTVDWDGDPMMQVTDIEKLPAGSELEYREARPPEDSEEPADAL